MGKFFEQNNLNVLRLAMLLNGNLRREFYCIVFCKVVSSCIGVFTN